MVGKVCQPAGVGIVQHGRYRHSVATQLLNAIEDGLFGAGFVESLPVR